MMKQINLRVPPEMVVEIDKAMARWAHRTRNVESRNLFLTKAISRVIAAELEET